MRDKEGASKEKLILLVCYRAERGQKTPHFAAPHSETAGRSDNGNKR